jgi:OmpA-OmpF porin, OOP family
MTCLALILLTTAGTASAQYDDEPLPSWYAGPFVGYALSDGDRNADDGLNFHLVAGRVIYDALGVELNLFQTSFGSELSGGPDTDMLGGGVDLALGLPSRGHPVFLLGAGAVQHDVGGQSKTSTYGDLGLGLYLPFGFADELWRIEARYHLLMGEHPGLPGEDMVEDVRLNLGVLFTFGGEEPAREPEPTPESLPPPPVEQAVEQPVVAPGPAPVQAPIAPAIADADGDGVPDADDRCPGTAAGATVDGKGCVEPETVVLRSAYFGSSSANLTATAYAVLRDVAASMKADPAMRLEVEGHADTSGSAATNVPLSQQRADIVRAALIEFGVDPARLVAKGYGAYRPVNDNATLEQRAYNRRVQFRRLEGGQ